MDIAPHQILFPQRRAFGELALSPEFPVRHSRDLYASAGTIVAGRLRSQRLKMNAYKSQIGSVWRNGRNRVQSHLRDVP